MSAPVATRHTHVRTSPRRGPAAAVVALATALTCGVLPAGTSAADPLGDVQARVDALDLQVDQAVEDYAQAQVQLEELTVRAAAAAAEVDRQQQALTQLQEQVGDVAAAAYRAGSAGSQLTLITGSRDPQAFLQKATSLDRLASRQADTLAEVRVARERFQDAVRRSRDDLARQQQVEQQAAERKAAIEADLARSQTLLDGLQAQQRAQLEAARAAQQAQDAARSAVAVRASRSRADVAGPGTTVDVPASGRAAAAVRAAYSRLGSPYRWGASGPSSFDCSGLTSWVWAQAGVSLPHSSRAQYAAGRKVSSSALQPGDLVYYGSPIHHVGIYVGGGNMISAPHTGDVVKVQPAIRGDFVGATRP